VKVDSGQGNGNVALATSTRKSRGVSSSEYASDKGEWS
jgi:hypothetical protein